MTNEDTITHEHTFLINIDSDCHNVDDKVFTSFDEDLYSDSSSSSGRVPGAIWGEYHFKPIAQIDWDNQVTQAVSALVDAPISAFKDDDLRPKLFDQMSK